MDAGISKCVAGLIVALCALTDPAPLLGQHKSRVSAPRPKATTQLPVSHGSLNWQVLGTSRGKRPIQGIKVGSGEFRVLVFGSLLGNDPAAVKLVDQLAIRAVRNEEITGGTRFVIVRSGNPDGLALKRTVNAANVKIATAFSTENTTRREPEVSFIIELLETYKPHRVIHLTSGPVPAALVLHNEEGRGAGLDLAEWLSAMAKPVTRFAPRGSVEQFIDESAEVVTLVIPRKSKPENVWRKYGDSVFGILAPNAPAEEWPLPTAWNKTDTAGPRVFQSGDTKAVDEVPPPRK